MKLSIITTFFLLFNSCFISQISLGNKNLEIDCTCYVMKQIDEKFIAYFQTHKLKMSGDELLHLIIDTSYNIEVNKYRNINTEHIHKIEEILKEIDFECMITKIKSQKPSKSNINNTFKIAFPYSKKALEVNNCR